MRAAAATVAGVALAVPVVAGFVALAATMLVGRSLLDVIRAARRRRRATVAAPASRRRLAA